MSERELYLEQLLGEAAEILSHIPSHSIQMLVRDIYAEIGTPKNATPMVPCSIDEIVDIVESMK